MRYSDAKGRGQRSFRQTVQSQTDRHTPAIEAAGGQTEHGGKQSQRNRCSTRCTRRRWSGSSDFFAPVSQGMHVGTGHSHTAHKTHRRAVLRSHHCSKGRNRANRGALCSQFRVSSAAPCFASIYIDHCCVSSTGIRIALPRPRHRAYPQPKAIPLTWRPRLRLPACLRPVHDAEQPHPSHRHPCRAARPTVSTPVSGFRNV